MISGGTYVFSELNYRNVVSMYINWKHTVRHMNYITLPRLFAAWMYCCKVIRNSKSEYAVIKYKNDKHGLDFNKWISHCFYVVLVNLYIAYIIKSGIKQNRDFKTLFVTIELIWHMYDAVCHSLCMVFMHFSDNVSLMMHTKCTHYILYTYTQCHVSIINNAFLQFSSSLGILRFSCSVSS